MSEINKITSSYERDAEEQIITLVAAFCLPRTNMIYRKRIAEALQIVIKDLLAHQAEEELLTSPRTSAVTGMMQQSRSANADQA